MELHVYDTEGDGLLDEITMLHCFVLQNLTTKRWTIFVDKERYERELVADNYTFDIDFELRDLSEVREFLSQKGKGYICHNQFGYDLQVFQKLGYIDSYGVAPDHINNVPVRLYDTLVMSRGLYPDRQLPLGCPTKVFNTVTKKNDMVGPHGLHSWGFRVANAKPKVDDWRDQPLGVYINRCIEDVKINKGTWEYLLREMNDDSFGVNWKPALQLLHRFDYRFKEQEKVGVAFNVEKGKQLVVDIDKMLEEIANDVEPLLPPRPLPKTKQPKFPAKPFLKSGALSASGIGYAAKFGIDEDGALEFIKSMQEGKPQPILTEPMRLSNQIDIKKFLVEVEGWEPTVFGTKDITRDEFKRLRSKAIIAEKAEEYLMKTILDSPYRKYLEEILGVKRGQGKQAFLDAVIKNARKLPTSPKLKDENGDLCPNLEKLKGDMATKIVKWLSLRSRRTVLLPLDDKKDTGWLNDSRVVSEGRLTAGSAGLTNTYRQKHRGVRNVPKADPDVLLGKEMRQLFYAPEGRMFQTLDTSNMENMIAAWLAMPYDGGAYYDKVNTGDPHTDNAKAYSLAAGREVGRGEGKGITYGVLYGAQKDKVAKMLGISPKKAQAVINAFWDTNHGLKGLKQYLEDFWESTGQLFILGVDGRRLYTRSKHSLLNTRIQSTGAIMMDLAYCKAYDKLRDEGLLELSPIVIYYHDEISNEVCLSTIQEWCFDTEEEAKEFSVEGKVLSEVSHWKGDGKFYRYYSRSGEILKESVQEASLELGSPFMLTGEYAIGPDWSCTH